MNIQLKEKMQKAAKEYCSRICTTCGDRNDCDRIDLGRCLPTEDNYDAFISGTAIMYAELAPLVEWVSVEDRLPETGKIVLLKNDLEDISTGCFTGKIFKIDFDEISSKKVTHWRRIELKLIEK